MTAITSVSSRRTTKMVSASGLLRNQHFLLTADHLLMELDSDTFDLVAANAEGNVEVHMVSPDPEEEYIAVAHSATFHPLKKRLTLQGWQGGRYNGVSYPPNGDRSEIVLPTDGSFFDKC